MIHLAPAFREYLIIKLNTPRFKRCTNTPKVFGDARIGDHLCHIDRAHPRSCNDFTFPQLLLKLGTTKLFLISVLYFKKELRQLFQPALIPGQFTIVSQYRLTGCLQIYVILQIYRHRSCPLLLSRATAPNIVSANYLHAKLHHLSGESSQ